MTAPRDLTAPVRFVRGAPRPEELAAVLVVLTALAATRRDPGPPSDPPRAAWPVAARPFRASAPAWAAAAGPQWRESSPG
ncbi:acyl-CoA carboxylase epsilon subunit [Streptomyces sp. NPDC056987]|uniref:acyl-CoA carboxylase epsilon subunit n=1 Tax=Streptomyces sp. NPDC056987 TaxID=3345988 RepID=UPI003634ABCA